MFHYQDLTREQKIEILNCKDCDHYGTCVYEEINCPITENMIKQWEDDNVY